MLSHHPSATVLLLILIGAAVFLAIMVTFMALAVTDHPAPVMVPAYRVQAGQVITTQLGYTLNVTRVALPASWPGYRRPVVVITTSHGHEVAFYPEEKVLVTS